MLAGLPASGKTASLRELEDQKGVLFINCESGKDIPFKNDFIEEVISDPEEVYELIADAEEDDSIHTVVIDSITMLMEMFESTRIIGAKDSRGEWQNYAQFFKNLMQQYVAPSRLRFIFIAHLDKHEDEETGEVTYRVPVKGALKRIGIEAFFSVIVEAKKVPLKKLKDYENDLLKITKRDTNVGYKHVFQTMPTKDNIGSCIRGPFDMFSDEEVYMDNNAQTLLDVLDDFYE